MVYYTEKGLSDRKIALYYSNLDVCNNYDAIDSRGNMVIVPEVFAHILPSFRNVIKIIWWLSVDYYKQTYIWGNAKKRLEYRGLPAFLLPLEVGYKLLFHHEEYIPSFGKKRRFINTFHMYNCEYVKRYLMSKGISEKEMAYLCGPVGDIFFDDKPNEKKEILLVYNPAKVVDKKLMETFLHKLKCELPQLRICAIKGLNEKEVYNMLKKSMLYVDFGSFPGPERMPREAVLLYNNIITSRIGSAENQIDVPIDDELKFEISNQGMDRAAIKALELLTNYKDYICLYNRYRMKALEQRDSFDKMAVNTVKKVWNSYNV